RVAAAEGAVAVHAGHTQIGWLVRVWEQVKGSGFEFRAAPGAFFERNGRGFAIVIAEGDGLLAGGVRLLVALASHDVGRGGHADPEPDFEGPFAELLDVFLALQLQGANQRGGAAELVERQEAERVAHEDADAGGGDSGVAEPAEDEGESGEAEVCLGLAATGGKEEEID